MNTICIIDDDALIRIAIEMSLCQHGFCVQSFSSATEFLENAAYDDISCVVTDIEMPSMTGLDLLVELSVALPECPIMVMTGKGEGAFREAALSLGACAYLEKPLSIGTLLDAIAIAVRRASGELEEHKPSRRRVSSHAAGQCISPTIQSTTNIGSVSKKRRSSFHRLGTPRGSN